MNETVRTHQPGDHVGGGRYTLKKILGHGGMGMVWLALDEKLNELTALKFISGPLARDSSSLAMLRREVARAHKLTHPNILRVHDLHEPPGEEPFIAMEYVDGPTLRQLGDEHPQRVLPWSELGPLALQLCEALAYAHGEGVVHRDIKPGNVMLDARGRVKLCDFGIAATFNEQATRLTGIGNLSGTPAYMSPQQMNGDRPTPSDDLYALGAMLYELLAGEPPFVRGNLIHQVQHKPAPPLSERMAELSVRHALPSSAETTILACLAKDPTRRPADARELASRLQSGTGNQSSPPWFRRKTPVLIGSVALLLAGLTIGGWLRWQAKEAPAPDVAAGKTTAAPGWQRTTFPTQIATDEIKTKGGIGMDGALLGVWKDAIHVVNPDQPLRNAAVRITAPSAQPRWPVKIVARMPPGRWTQYTLHVWPKMVEVSRYDQGDHKLKTFPLAQPLTDGDGFTAQFASIGSEHYVWINGRLLGSVTDATFSGPAKFGVQAPDGRYGSVETLLLDGLSEADALKSAGGGATAPPAVNWTDITQSLRKPDLRETLRDVDGEWIEATRESYPSPVGGRVFRDSAVRITYANRMEVQFRKTPAGSYAASVEGNVCNLLAVDAKGTRVRLTPATQLSADYRPEAPHELLVIANGPLLSLWIDGRKQAEAKDSRFNEGAFSLSLFADGKSKPPRIKKVEIGEF